MPSATYYNLGLKSYSDEIKLSQAQKYISTFESSILKKLTELEEIS